MINEPLAFVYVFWIESSFNTASGMTLNFALRTITTRAFNPYLESTGLLELLVRNHPESES